MPQSTMIERIGDTDGVIETAVLSFALSRFSVDSPYHDVEAVFIALGSFGAGKRRRPLQLIRR